MKPKKKPSQQNHLFEQRLDDLLDQRQRLYRLAHAIDWEPFETAFEELYSDVGRPAKPTRLMVGLLMLKQLENLSDERVCEAWARDAYMQYFCGETHFQWGLPCEPSELVHFRHRIGQRGANLILKASIELHRDQVQSEDELVADTTVQETHIAYPVDHNLYRDCIEKLWKLGAEAGVKWRRSYRFTVPRLLRTIRTRSNRLTKARGKAVKKLRTVAGRLWREFEREASPGWRLLCREDLALIERVLTQQRSDRNKVYSLHEPGTLCIAKGKAHKKYEFGRKVSIAMTRDSGVIVSAQCFEENLYDGDTLPDALAQAHSLTGRHFSSVLVDRGYRGEVQIGATRVELPKPARKRDTAYHRKKHRQRYARRSAIEPVIGHLKSDYRMARSYLKGALGSAQNAALAAAAWNLKLWLNRPFWARFRKVILNLRLTFRRPQIAFAGLGCHF